MSRVVELYPIYNIHIFLSTFRNVDLPSRGYYQIRIRGNCDEGETEVEARVDSQESEGEEPIFAASIHEKCAVSRTVEVLYAYEDISINDAFLFTVRGAPSCKPFLMSLDVQLWYMDNQQPPRLSGFSKLNSRRMEVMIDAKKSFQSARILNFECYAFGSLSLSVYGALISLLPRRRKDPPDPPMNDVVRKEYSEMCSSLLETQDSLLSFLNSNQQHFQAQVHLPSLRVSEEKELLMARLESADTPWHQLEEDAIALSSRLSLLFTQTLRLCASSPAILAVLLSEFTRWRSRHLAELVLCREGAGKELLPLASLHSALSGLSLLALPQHPFLSSQLDFDSSNMPLIIEEVALPTESNAVEAAHPMQNDERASAAPPIHSTAPDSLTDLSSLVIYAAAQEQLKRELNTRFGFDFHLVNERRRHPPFKKNLVAATPKSAEIHLIVFVHGLEGAGDDLMAFRVHIKHLLAERDVEFLSSRCNERSTWGDVQELGSALLEEVDSYVSRMRCAPWRVSFVAHSLGGLIVRAAVAEEGAEWLRPRLHTFFTLNSPHLGLIYASKASTLGLTLVQWYKRSRCLSQLSLRDSVLFDDCLLLRLASSHSLGCFRNVLLLGSYGDWMVPAHSALITNSPAVEKDKSSLGAAYSHMLHEVEKDLEGCHVVRFSVVHRRDKSKLSGRPAHTACVEDSLFAEKIIAVAADYFT